MQPPAEVEPANVSTIEHFGSASIWLKISAARAVSRDVNDILPMALMIGRASNEVKSMCSTGVESNAAFLFDLLFFLAMASFNPFADH
jgi:hypothetical protein